VFSALAAPAPPTTIARMASNVHLRPMTDADLPVLELTRSDPEEASAFGYFGFRDTA
jgi:hypothetical protein